MAMPIDPKFMRAPDELAVTPSAVGRVLVVGSCLVESWVHRLPLMSPPCDSDIYLFGSNLPETPARPISDYDFQIVQLPLRFILPDLSFARLKQTDITGHETLFSHAANGMRRLLNAAMRWNREHGLLTFVFPFVVPQQNSIGRLNFRYDLRNPVYFVEKINEALANELKKEQNAYFFDFNEIISTHGRCYFQEDAYMAFNHGGSISNYDFNHDQGRLETACKATDFYEAKVGNIIAAAWQEMISMYRTIRQIDMVKMVVVDLDDTLWRGVIAELNIDELPTSEGWPKGFWESLAFLKRRGILLAIISKNEESRVFEVWDQITRRNLSLDDFAIRRINWRPKADNMAEILAHVNLLPRNVVYIDDNPAERAAIKDAFPEIRVLGGTPLTWRRILLWSAETQVAEITTESAARTEMVRAQVTREETRNQLSHKDFLSSLKVQIKLFQANDASHPRFSRVLELINKTNQFNTTGRRWTREECIAALAAGTTFYAFDVSDIYTDYGLVGVVVVDDAGIQQFVMSCRIMGLEAEVAAVARIMEIQRLRGATVILGVLVETDRNLPSRDLYLRCGFEASEGVWRRVLSPGLAVPPHITLVATAENPVPLPPTPPPAPPSAAS